jgi:glucose-1-phosphate thymidylyltransferase
LKALVLSGGQGTRLRPMTLGRSKQLIPVANRPVLHYVLQNIADAGIKETIVVIGEDGRQIRDYVGNGARWGLAVTYVQQRKPLGLAHAVLTAREKLGEASFLMYLGDNLLPNGIAQYLRVFQEKRPDALVLVHPVTNPQSFGIAKLVDSRVVEVLEKPTDPPSNLALIGVYFFSPKIHESIARITPSARGELEITDAIQDLLSRGGQVEAERVCGPWHDTGQANDLLAANKTMLLKLEHKIEGHIDPCSTISGPVQISAGTVVVNSRICGPAIIGEDCALYNSFIGPFTAVQKGTRLIDTAVCDSIILAGCRLENVPLLNHSILGENTELTTSPRSQPGWQLLTADHTRLSVPV